MLPRHYSGDPRSVERGPSLLVFTTTFPNEKQPQLGLFVRERMFRVAQRVPACFVAPVPWFPLQPLVGRYRPYFRPTPARVEQQGGHEVHHPRFLSVPGVLKRADGFLLAASTLATVRRLVKQHGVTLIDAHFGYPDGYAATLLGRWLKLPVTVTIRGNEEVLARNPALRPLLASGLRRALRVFSVSDSLRTLALDLGVEDGKAITVSNGVDLDTFQPIPRTDARRELGIPLSAPVLVSVGGLVEGKGFHRVIAALPPLRAALPELVYLIAGGPTPIGDWRPHLERQTRELGLEGVVRFLGPVPPERLKWVLSAADVFVLATAREGWANVFLEAMACGLPVVTTRVGGNAEVVRSGDLGILVPFGEQDALANALREALTRHWDRGAILAYARDNDWGRKIDRLVEELRTVVAA